MSAPLRAEAPLRGVERAVLAAAKAIALDLADPTAADALRGLIADAIDRWRADHRRGIHDHDIVDPTTIADRCFRNLAGYGPLDPLLADDDVWEIMLNAPDQIFVKRHRGRSGYHISCNSLTMIAAKPSVAVCR